MMTTRNRVSAKMASQDQLHCRSMGEGPSLLFLHGLFDSLHTWDPLFPHLSHSFKLYAIDLPGFGKSPPPPLWTDSISQTVDAVERFLDDRSAGFHPALTGEKISVVGNSMGAGIALALAQRRPERIDRLILINPYGLPDLPGAVRIARNKILKKMLPYLLTKPVLKKTTEWIYRRSFHNPRCATPALIEEAITPLIATRQRKNLFCFLDGIRPDEMNRIDRLLPTLPLPMRILWGTEDRWLSFEHAQRLIKRIPHCTWAPISESGHLPHFEKPEAVAREIRAFLSGS